MRRTLNGFIKSISLLLLLFIILTLHIACLNPAPDLKPAEFEVQDIYIYPDTAMPGDDVTVSVTVKNIGDVADIYPVVLKMGQVDYATYDLPVSANAIKTYDFKITAPDSGIYHFSVGESTKSLQVYDWQKYKIVYDSCMGGLGEWGFGYTFFDPDAGCSAYFNAPSKYFKVDKLTVFAFWRPMDLPDPGEYEFTINIWSDETRRQRLWTQDYPYSRFKNEGSLSELEVPGVRTDGNFYVEVVPRSVRNEIPDPLSGKYLPKCALYIGLCVRTDNANAGVTYKGSSVLWPENWPEQSECSFMIRVEGEGSPEIRK